MYKLILILRFLKELTGHEGLSSGLNLQIHLPGLYTLLIAFGENLLLHLKYSCFVVNFMDTCHCSKF